MKTEPMKTLSGIMPGMSSLLQDVCFGLRMLRKNPVFSGIAVLTLALGIAGNILIFSFFNSLYLKPFPFKEPSRLVDLDQTAPRWNLEYTALAYPDFYAWREHNRAFESMGAWTMESYNLSYQNDAERIRGARVTHDLATVFGIKPVAGRLFTAEEDRRGGDKVVLLGHALWQRRFGGADVLGKVLRLNHESYTIIGVLPRDTAILENTEFWVPLAENPAPKSGNYYLRGVGRLKPKMTLEMARADLQRVHRSLLEEKKTNENTSPKLTALSDRFFGGQRLVIRVLMAAVGLVLLIACGNVAALMLARGMTRSREFGIRLSLGATRWRIAQLIGVEALLLSGLGGCAGALLGFWGLKTLLASLPEALPIWVTFGFDWRIGLFTVTVVLAAACLGAFPVIRSACQAELQGGVQSATRQATFSGAKRRGLNALVVAELAFTVVLMVQAGLLVQAFRFLQRADPGYRAENVLLYEIALPGARYASKEVKMDFFKRHLEAVGSLPGVLSASVVNAPPHGGHYGTFFQVENAAPRGPNDPDPVILQRISFPSYFETMHMKLIKGRGLTEQDGLNEGSLAVVVNEMFAQRFWPNQDPVGKRIRYRDEKAPWITVVGVVQDVKHYGLDRPMIPGVYVPYAQEPLQQMSVVVRSAVAPSSLVPSIRTMLRQLDADLPMFGVTTMQKRLSNSMVVRRTYSSLIGIFAGVALIMAIGGIGGVFAYVVSRRTQEIGIRLALGAQPGDVLRMVLRQGMALTLTGIGIGLVMALITTPLMRGLLFGVSPADPLTFCAISLLLSTIALLACYVPARQAMKVEPMVALRCE